MAAKTQKSKYFKIKYLQVTQNESDIQGEHLLAFCHCYTYSKIFSGVGQKRPQMNSNQICKLKVIS